MLTLPIGAVGEWRACIPLDMGSNEDPWWVFKEWM